MLSFGWTFFNAHASGCNLKNDYFWANGNAHIARSVSRRATPPSPSSTASLATLPVPASTSSSTVSS
eukprot:scaffold77422_cov58-Phaeocystis_antarctica.AAC.2